MLCSTFCVWERLVGQSDIEMKDTFPPLIQWPTWEYMQTLLTHWRHYCIIKFMCGDAPFITVLRHKLSVHLWLLCWYVQNKHADCNLWLYIPLCECVICFSLTVVRVIILNWKWSTCLLYVLHTKINNAVIQQPVYLGNNLHMFLENTTCQLFKL